MILDKIELPSNRKFGYFFCGIFSILTLYFLYKENFIICYIFLFISLTFISITILKSDLLLPLNKLWMQFGFLLGLIISPIILGIIFFGIFTPFGITMRIFGRDELKLKPSSTDTNWVQRSSQSQTTDFRRQF